MRSSISVSCARPFTEFVHVNAGQTVTALLQSSGSVTVEYSEYAHLSVTSGDKRVTIQDNEEEGFYVTGPVNALVQLNYSLNTQEYEPVGWVLKSEDRQKTLRVQQTSVSIPIGEVGFACPSFLPPAEQELTYFTHRASVTSGLVFLGEEKGLCLLPATYTVGRDMSTAPPEFGLGPVRFRVNVNGGAQVSHSDVNLLEVPITQWNVGGAYCDATEPMVSHTTMVPQPQLDWAIESMDEEGAPPESLGYCVADPASAYYFAATPHNQDSFEGDNNLVALTAAIACGQEFVRWKGTGDVYTEEGVVRTDVRLDASDEDTEHWVTDDTIYIKMAKKNSPWSPQNQSPVAMCQSNKRALIVIAYGINPNIEEELCCNADQSLENMRYNVTHLYGNSVKQETLQELKNNSVFRFVGHGTSVNGDELLINEEDPLFPEYLLENEIPAFCKYSLVVLNSCYSSCNPTWKSAFNADCFIGWKTPISASAVRTWEDIFWPKMKQQGMNAKRAFDEADEELRGSLSVEIFGDVILVPKCE